MSRRIVKLCWISALALTLIGGGLVLLSAVTPAYLDEAAHAQAVLAAGDLGMHQDATYAYRTAERRFATGKWRYADWGYGTLAWAAITAGTAGLLQAKGVTFLQATRNRVLVLLLSILGVIGLGATVLALFFHLYFRNVFPPWADTPVFGLIYPFIVMTLLGPIVLVLTMSPLLRSSRSPGPSSILILRSESDARTGFANVVYGIPILLCALGALAPFATAGWVYCPTAALLGWLFLNARALALAPPE